MDFVAKSERALQQQAEVFNNLFVKNFPNDDFSEDDLRQVFQQFGRIASIKIDESHQFGFVAFEKPEDAQAALTHFNKPENDDEQQPQLKVVKCQKREQRDHQLKQEHLKIMRELARNNLYFKGFPVDG